MDRQVIGNIGLATVGFQDQIKHSFVQNLDVGYSVIEIACTCCAYKDQDTQKKKEISLAFFFFF